MDKKAISRTAAVLIVIGIIVVAGIVGGIAWYLATTQGPPTTIEPIKIGMEVDFTGPTVYESTSAYKGALAVLEKINEEGGINGRPLVWYVYDTALDPKQGSIVAEKLIKDHGVVAILCLNSDPAMLATASLCEEYKIPLVNAYCIGTQSLNYSFSANVDAGPQARVMALYAVREMGMTKIAEIQTDFEYNELYHNYFAQACERLGASIVYHKKAPFECVDYKTYLTEIKALLDAGEADGVLLNLMHIGTGYALAQMRELGFGPHDYKIIGNGIGQCGMGTTDDITTTQDVVWKIAGSAVDGFYHLIYFDASSQAYKEWSKFYYEREGIRPDLFANYGHDAAVVLTEAIKHSDATPEGIHKALYEIKDFELVNGGLFRGFIDTYFGTRQGAPFDLWVIRRTGDGKFTYVAHYTDVATLTPGPLPSNVAWP
jgi:branched-chain amino acid transport system substrate-binding protein